MKILQAAWRVLRAGYFFVKPIRFVFIPLILLLWALIWSDEGQDAVRALVEVDRTCPHAGRLMIFLVVVIATAFQCWYWSRQLLRIERVAAAAREHERAERLTPRLLGASVFLIAIAALGRAWYLSYGGGPDFTTRMIVATIAALLVLLAAFIAFVTARRRAIGPIQRVASHEEFGAVTIWVLRATVIVAAAFVVWTAVSPLSAGYVFQSPSLLMLSAALWAGLGSWLAYWFDSYHVPLAATFLIAAVVFSCWNDNHAVRTLPSADGGAPASRQPLDATFNAWYGRLETAYPLEPRHPVFIVATEGGGIRAAYWTAAVLSAIQDQAPDFGRHLFAISSVSGGSLGGTLFTALLADAKRGSAADDCGSPADERSATYRFAAQQVLSYDFLAPTLGSLLHADFLQRFLPIGFIPDRAKALETGWQTGWREHIRAKDGTPDDFFAGGLLKMYGGAEANALLPSLFLNGTSVEVGNRLIASNCDLKDGAIPDAADLFDLLGKDMRLSTAAHNSARFTYVSPAGTIRSAGGPAGHVVDGGYFENSGAATAADVMSRLALIRGTRSYDLYLILIRYQEIATDPRNACRPLPPGPPSSEHFMNEVMSPLRALLNTRNARGTLAYAEAQHSRDIHPPAFEFILTQKEHGIVLPLGWLLARRTRNAIDLQIGPAVPPETDCAIRPFVTTNVANLRSIAAMVAPPRVRVLRAPAAVLDPVQREARQSERAARQ